MNTKVKKYKKMFRQEVAQQLLDQTEQEMIFHREFEQICEDQAKLQYIFPSKNDKL
jgi:hypothetical protein